jgi:hypothetical protein
MPDHPDGVAGRDFKGTVCAPVIDNEDLIGRIRLPQRPFYGPRQVSFGVAAWNVE